MTLNFPTRYDEIRRWIAQEGVSEPEGGRRYAQYLILRSIGQSGRLRESLVFKGGNALEFVYQHHRSTIDLDFSFLKHDELLSDLIDTLRDRLNDALSTANDGYGTVLRLQSLRQNPPGEHMRFPTITARIAYALPNQPRQQELLLAGNPGANVIPVEMSVNEVICEWHPVNIGPDIRDIRVASIEDIVAEKLRAILQQVVRNRYRSQDVLDIAAILGNSRIPLDRTKIATFLLAKCAARDIEATRSAFLNPEVRDRAATGYADLADTVRHRFIAFDEAWSSVLGLVSSLDIPDSL